MHRIAKKRNLYRLFKGWQVAAHKSRLERYSRFGLDVAEATQEISSEISRRRSSSKNLSHEKKSVV